MQCTQTLELLIKALDILLLSVTHLKPEILAQHPVLIVEPHITSKKKKCVMFCEKFKFSV